LQDAPKYFIIFILGGLNLTFITWNIDSLGAALTGTSQRAALSRNVLCSLADIAPDAIALQETKLPPGGLSEKQLGILNELFPEYTIVVSCSAEPARKSYAGTMFLYKSCLCPMTVSFPQIGAPGTMDYEGRLITLEFEHFFLVGVYTPNAGESLARLSDRQVWDIKFADYLACLDTEKYVVAGGDFNVAHREIDLAHPKSNRGSAGFTDEEREGFSNLLARGFTDTFRYLHGDVTGVYSWWTQLSKTSKINNSGWRIDYWLVSDRIADKVKRSEIIDTGPRQDHAPVLLEIEI